MINSIAKNTVAFLCILMLHSFCLAQNNSGFKSKNTTVVKTSEQSQAVAKYNDVIHDNQVQDTTFKFGSYKIKGDKKLHGKAKREVKKGDYYFSLGRSLVFFPLATTTYSTNDSISLLEFFQYHKMQILIH